MLKGNYISAKSAFYKYLLKLAFIIEKDIIFNSLIKIAFWNIILKLQ